MSHQPVIDGFEFATAGATQEGTLPLASFPRLQDALVSDSGNVACKEMAVRDLVEDELILALPYAPRHDGCEARPEGSDADRAASSPFAGLRGMMQRKH